MKVWPVLRDRHRLLICDGCQQPNYIESGSSCGECSRCNSVTPHTALPPEGMRNNGLSWQDPKFRIRSDEELAQEITQRCMRFNHGPDDIPF